MDDHLAFDFSPYRRTRRVATPSQPSTEPATPLEPSLAPVTAAEDPAQFLAFRQLVLDDFSPASPLDLYLAESLAIDLWRKRRLAAVHAAALDHEMDHQHDDLQRQFETVDSHTRHFLAYDKLGSKSTLHQVELSENAADRRARALLSALRRKPRS